jgi:beta-glucosidase
VTFQLNEDGRVALIVSYAAKVPYDMARKYRLRCAAISVALAAGSLQGATVAPTTAPGDWPQVTSSIPKDPAIEKRVARMVMKMTLQQKIGQMTQAEIKFVTPAEVSQYYLGSVLNGGGSWPGGDKHASAAAWVALADAFYQASMATDMAVKVPVIWGIDAIHGNSNVFGATLFPHNIGLGAAHNPALVRRIGVEVGKAVRATGINWVFAPTLAVVQDVRWGRTYESFSQDPVLVRQYAGAYVTGLQGSFKQDGNVIATAKHYMGDGGTDQGKDRGVNLSSLQQMINIHGAGYYSALAAGAQTVMASFHSWNDVGAGVDHGKVHGSRYLLTDVLKNKFGFDGFVISDWDAIGEVPGCTTSSCAQAINAGIDMVMAPQDWKAFIANTLAQVQSGQIPMARIDDAVTRILRVKMRAGMFGRPPSANAYAGKAQALLARELARESVRESLVLLKNNGGVLPLARGKKILVVGKSADNMQNQTGGWSLTWQGTDNGNADFPNGDTLLAAIRAANGGANVSYLPSVDQVDLSQFDLVIAVIGETPYAEGDGDIGPASTLRLSNRHPEDLAVLRAVTGKGRPVVTILLSGRPLYVNDMLNLSDAFVAAWLPGTEGKGVTDVLFRGGRGGAAHDFKGRLSFSWPNSACVRADASGAPSHPPLFTLGYGLSYAHAANLPALDVSATLGGCGKSNLLPVFDQSDRATFPLFISNAAQRLALGADLNNPVELPGIRVEVTQLHTQQDAKLVTWSGPARLEARGAKPVALPAYATDEGALQFDVAVKTAPQTPVLVAMDCGPGCYASVNLQAMFQALAGGAKQTISIPLKCFIDKGVKLDAVDTPFSVMADKPLVAAFTNIRIAGGAAKNGNALACTAFN